ncbi:MAG TPA: DUF1844 domain-containing protein [Deferrimonas sp.]
MPEEKEDKGFKVIDRRGVEQPPAPPPTPPLKEKPPSAATEGQPTGVSPPKHPQEDSPLAGAKEGVPQFLDLVQSLQMGAMAGLGMLQGPDGKRPPVDLPAAKDAIDLLGILQEKTKGNLTKEEEEVLREGLYHLRMGYMAMINAPLAGRGKGGDQR